MTSPFNRTQRAGLYIAGWLPLWILYGIALAATMSQGIALGLVCSGFYFVPAIAVGAAAWQLANRVPWRRLSIPAFAGLEIALDLGFLLTWQAAFAGLLWLTAGPATAKANSWLIFLSRDE